MGLRINTNINAQYAIMNLNNTNNKLSQSLNRLSTGLRITKAADDAAGMTIADGLKFQATNLGQAISNGNNATKLIQIADMALQKSIDIVGTIAQKATQAANATEDSSSRNALQSDISKFIEELNNISLTTSYKGTKLLDGTFTNKLVHIGAYMNQTLSIGAQRTHSDSIGWVAYGTTAPTDNSAWDSPGRDQSQTLVQYNNLTHLAEIQANNLKINNIAVGQLGAGINAQQQIDAKTAAAAINSVQAQTGGVEAAATTTVTTNAAVAAGTINSGDLLINGVDIGQVNVGAGDADGALVNKINEFQTQTGVVASTNNNNQLVLTASDGRNISVIANTNATTITGLANKETDANGTINNITNAMSFYLNGVHITLAAGISAASAATAINNALAAAGMNTTTQLKASATAATGGDLVLRAIDGRDLNIHVSATEAALSHLSFIGLGATGATANTATDYLANDSNHGKITFVSTNNIAISGDHPEYEGLAAGNIAPNKRLKDVNVTTQQGAELAIKISQSALSDLDKVRSNLGSIQNQITATVENISVTQININAAESSIRDVNFAKESSNFSKLQILAQSGTYALAQSNAVQQNVLRLLQ